MKKCLQIFDWYCTPTTASPNTAPIPSKFADDATIISIITNNDEKSYWEEIKLLMEWWLQSLSPSAKPRSWLLTSREGAKCMHHWALRGWRWKGWAASSISASTEPRISPGRSTSHTSSKSSNNASTSSEAWGEPTCRNSSSATSTCTWRRTFQLAASQSGLAAAELKAL